MECPPECLDCRYPYRSNTRLYAAHGPLPLEDETTDSIHHKLSDAERYRVWLKDHGHSPPKPVEPWSWMKDYSLDSLRVKVSKIERAIDVHWGQTGSYSWGERLMAESKRTGV